MARLGDDIDMLRRRADFVAASRDGVKIGGPVVALHMRVRAEQSERPRVGFTVTKRVGGAVERNRMKRRMRAAVRVALEGAARPDCDYVLIARRAVLEVKFERLARDVATATKRAHGKSAGGDRADGRPGAADRRTASGPTDRGAAIERPESGR
ncbi:ribonuclease P protein component [Methylopila sp. M107]|uniref:ribonuclease P protein component n=1 Tax=Methylopila sp. M107 TaxID=1101190 RepID=UPI00036B7337|nr:ribonuclease P protein component [Methylopila sp. M107]